MYILSLMILFPVLVAFFLLPIRKTEFIKYISFSASMFIFIFSLLTFINVNDLSIYDEKYTWISSIGINIYFGVDNLSMLMVILTNFLMPLAILSSYSYITHNIKKYYFWMMILHSSMIGVFISKDAFLFYIFWEMILIPMYFLIGIWGGENRIYASVKFFIYTMSASVLFLIGIIIVYFNLKSNGIPTFEITDFYKNTLSGNLRLFVFLSFLLAFAVKIPMIPLHTWLPDAHVEAPTAASVILAGVLLKMGGYGFLRFLIPAFPDLSLKYSYIISLIGSLAALYAGFMAWMQTDIKKLIAYSSISHMGLVVLGIFSFNTVAINGSILQMINHGISSGALFLAVGIIYERMHTRSIYDYGGIFKIVPFYSTFFMIVMLSSIGLPITNGFVGELLIFQGSFKTYKFLTLIAMSGIIIGAVYMLALYEKVFFGRIVNKSISNNLVDLNLREWIYTIPFMIVIFLIGIFPNFLITKINEYTLNLLAGVLK